MVMRWLARMRKLRDKVFRDAGSFPGLRTGQRLGFELPAGQVIHL
jgi:hypothetical protein